MEGYVDHVPLIAKNVIKLGQGTVMTDTALRAIKNFKELPIVLPV